MTPSVYLFDFVQIWKCSWNCDKEQSFKNRVLGTIQHSVIIFDD